MSLTSFYYRTIFARTYNMMLNSSGERGHPCLFPNFRWKVFSLLPLNVVLAVFDFFCKCTLFSSFSLLFFSEGDVEFCQMFFLHVLKC